MLINLVLFYYFRTLIMASNDQYRILKFFSAWKIMIPVGIGVSISVYMIITALNVDVFSSLRITPRFFLWVFIGILMMALRDLAYMYRLRLITDKELSWRSSFQIWMLWEFASALTPSVVGGATIAWIIVHKEKIPFGRSTALVMITSFLDEFFFILMAPLIFLFFSNATGFFQGELSIFGLEFLGLPVFIIAYSFIVFLATFIFTAVFLIPKSVKKFLIWFFSLPFLNRWKGDAAKMGDDLASTAKEMKGKPFTFWLKAFGATSVAWIARFSIVNCLILAFMPFGDNFALYARQLVMWIVLMISPTPGGSGVAEFLFNDYLGMFLLVGMAPILAVLWRLMTYYFYVIIGSIVLPIWLRRVFSNK